MLFQQGCWETASRARQKFNPKISEKPEVLYFWFNQGVFGVQWWHEMRAIQNKTLTKICIIVFISAAFSCSIYSCCYHKFYDYTCHFSKYLNFFAVTTLCVCVLLGFWINHKTFPLEEILFCFQWRCLNGVSNSQGLWERQWSFNFSDSWILVSKLYIVMVTWPWQESAYTMEASDFVESFYWHVKSL